MLQHQVNELFDSQLREWAAARRNFDDLSSVEVAEIVFPSYRMLLTFNPGRIRSTAAKVDRQTIAERRCFLCPANRPAEQRGIDYEGRYTILVNPFPIFRRHLTIPDTDHTDQLLDAARLEDMLALARELSGHTLFYNGPKCGASAPDHFHFQAGERGYMPAERECFEGAEPLARLEGVSIAAKRGYLRLGITLEGADASALARTAMRILRLAGRTVPREPEPMANILCWREDAAWRMILFPRREHRPRQFFAEGAERIVFSPGAVDFGGVLVLPRREDFERLRRDTALIEDMFAQLTLDEKQERELLSAIQNLQP